MAHLGLAVILVSVLGVGWVVAVRTASRWRPWCVRHGPAVAAFGFLAAAVMTGQVTGVHLW
jgi:hypothetical protein